MVQDDLEKKACESLLQELEKNDECNINVFLTDRHKGNSLLYSNTSSEHRT